MQYDEDLLINSDIEDFLLRIVVYIMLLGDLE